MITIRQADYKVMPWKNGRGQTAEIDRFPRDSKDYLWRLSQARIDESGLFSLFPGYDRWLMVWRGPGIFLNQKFLEPFKPHRFSGDHEMQCRLKDAAVTDVGLIFNRAKVKVEAKIIQGKVTLPVSSAETTHYFFDLGVGDTRVIHDGPTFIDVPPSLWFAVHSWPTMSSQT